MAILVSGLDSDRYLINNEIWITLSSGTSTIKYTIKFDNNNTSTTSASIVIYANTSGNARVNLSPILKSMFAYPKSIEDYVTNNKPTNNANTFTITISEVSNPDVVIEKVFIRGGKRVNGTNQTLQVNEICRPTYLLPIWPSFDTADYILTGASINKILLSAVPDEQKDYRRAKGCNEIYLKFLNQKGGYCNWLFESHSMIETNTPKGSFVRNNLVDDLGSESDSKMKIYSKVPEYYIDYINDLIVSPEVYAMINGVYVRVIVSKNTVEQDNIKRSYSVNLNIDFEYRFNPTLLWSN